LDIGGLQAVTRRGGLAIVIDSSPVMSRLDGLSANHLLDVRKPADALVALQQMIGGQ